MTLLILEWLGAAFATAGTVLLALNGSRAGFGFVLYLASNAAWLSFAWISRDWAILTQNIVFVASSLLGIWVWLLGPLAREVRALYRSERLYRGRWRAACRVLRRRWH